MEESEPEQSVLVIMVLYTGNPLLLYKTAKRNSFYDEINRYLLIFVMVALDSCKELAKETADEKGIAKSLSTITV